MRYFDDLEFIRAGIDINTVISLKFVARSYSIEYIHSGTLTMYFNGKCYSHDGPCIYHLYPGASVEYDTGHGCQKRNHYWVCFLGERVRRYLEGGLLEIRRENPFKKVYDTDLVLYSLQKLITLVNTNGNHAQEVLLLENILLSLQEQKPIVQPVSDFYAEGLKQLILEIIKNPQKSWNFNAESAKLNITLNHFNRIFRKIAQNSPRQFVIQRRLQKASELLIHTNCEIKEVAESIGIDNEFYFSRLFKKHFKISPSGYRQKLG